MASWHQEQAGLGGLYAAHPSGWKTIQNPRGESASAIVHRTREQAESFIARRGGIVVPPSGLRLFQVYLTYRTPSGRQSCERFIVRESDEGAAAIEAGRRLVQNKRRRVASPVEQARVTLIQE